MVKNEAEIRELIRHLCSFHVLIRSVLGHHGRIIEPQRESLTVMLATSELILKSFHLLTLL